MSDSVKKYYENKKEEEMSKKVSKEAQEYSANATKSAAGKTALGSMMGTLGAAIIGLR